MSEVLSGLKDKERCQRTGQVITRLKTAVYDDMKLISTIEQNKPQATVRSDNKKQLTNFVADSCICIIEYVCNEIG